MSDFTSTSTTSLEQGSEGEVHISLQHSRLSDDDVVSVARQRENILPAAEHGSRSSHELEDLWDPSTAWTASSYVNTDEQWDVILNIDARILEVQPDWVRMDCLIDRQRGEFQERIFDRNLLEGAVPVFVGAYVLIRIRQKPGKLLHTFFNGDKYVRKASFESIPFLDDLAVLDSDSPL